MKPRYILYFVFFLWQVNSLLGQNTDAIFRIITQKHGKTPYYKIEKGEINTGIKDEYNKEIVYEYEFIQRKHKDKIFAFVVLSHGIQYYRYYSSKIKTASQFEILNKNTDSYWSSIELFDLNGDNIREIFLNYEVSYSSHRREVYNFSTDSVAPVILGRPYDDGVLVCLDSAKNLYFRIGRNNIRGM